MAFFMNLDALCTYGCQSSSSIFVHKHHTHTEFLKTENGVTKTIEVEIQVSE